MANKYHRQGFVGAGLVAKLVASKADKADTLLKLVREARRLRLKDKKKYPKFRMKATMTGKAKEYDKEILAPEDYIDIQNMTNNQLKKQIQKYGFIVGTKNKKLAERDYQRGSIQKLIKKDKKK
tara:strand:- start:322 stop:693 length:372 start_codon:yes stop_codon:yes gene_type:complete